MLHCRLVDTLPALTIYRTTNFCQPGATMTTVICDEATKYRAVFAGSVLDHAPES